MPILDSRTLDPLLVPDEPEPVLESYTASTENCGFASHACVLDSATHTAVTIGTDVQPVKMGWWNNDRMARTAAWVAIINSTSQIEEMAA